MIKATLLREKHRNEAANSEAQNSRRAFARALQRLNPEADFVVVSEELLRSRVERALEREKDRHV